jgi:hypothetical protein
MFCARPLSVQNFIKYFGIGNLEISLGRFNLPTRMRGVLHQDKLVLSTILDSAGRITESWKDVLPGNVAIFPTGVELDVIHGGGACYLTVSIPLPELSSRLDGEEHLADPELWDTKRVFNIDPFIGAEMLHRLMVSSQASSANSPPPLIRLSVFSSVRLSSRSCSA